MGDQFINLHALLRSKEEKNLTNPPQKNSFGDQFINLHALLRSKNKTLPEEATLVLKRTMSRVRHEVRT